MSRTIVPNASMSTRMIPEYGTAAPFTARSWTWQSSFLVLVRLSFTHASVIVVTSLPVSMRAGTSHPLMVMVVAGHLAAILLFLPPAAWLLETTGVRSFPVVLALC